MRAMTRQASRDWKMLLATSYDAIQLNKRAFRTGVEDVAGNGTGRYCTPCQSMPVK